MKESSPILSKESGSVFYEGIGLVLSRWSALALAIDNEWGGRNSRQKSDLIHSDIYSWFTLSTEPLYIDDLEEKLSEGLLTLNTQVDDGSVEEIAEKLMIMHEECLDGNYKSVEGLRESSHHRVPVSHVREANDDDDDDSDMDVGPGTAEDDGSQRATIESSRYVPHRNSDDMQVDDPTPQPSADNDDGWVVVKPKRGGGRK